MGKKKKEGETVSISLADISVHAPKEFDLPSGPTMGIMDKNIREHSYGNQSQQFFKFYGREDRGNFSSQSRGGFSRNRGPPRSSTAPPVNFGDLREKVNRPRGQTRAPRREETTPNFQSNMEPRLIANRRRSPERRDGGWKPKSVQSIRRDTDTSQRAPMKDFASLKKQWKTPEKKEIKFPMENLEKPSKSGRVGMETRGKPLTEKTHFEYFQRKITAPRDAKRAEKSPFDNFPRKIKAPIDTKSAEQISPKKTEEKGAEKKAAKEPEEKNITPKIEKPKAEDDSKRKEKTETELPNEKTDGKTEKAVAEASNALKNAKIEQSEEKGKKVKPAREKLTMAEILARRKAKPKPPKTEETVAVKEERKFDQKKVSLSERIQRRREAGSEDVLTKLTKKRLQAERKKKEEEERKQKERKREDSRKKLRKLETLFRLKHNDEAEFYGHFKGSNETVDHALWKLGLKKFLCAQNKHEKELTILSAWCLSQNVVTFKSLGETLRECLQVEEGEESERSSKEILKSSFIAKVLRCFALNFGEKYLCTKFEREGADLATLLDLKTEKLELALKAEKLEFMTPKKSLYSDVERMVKDGVKIDSICGFLSDKCNKESFENEPEIADLVTQKLFADYFVLPEETLAAAVKVDRMEQSEEEETPSDSQDEEEAPDLSPRVTTTVSRKVKDFFHPFSDLLVLLRDSSRAHQLHALNVMASEWEKSATSRTAVEKALRAIYEMGFVSYEGVSEWRYWVPSSDAEKLLSPARRRMLIATTLFLDGDMEDEHQLSLRREEAEFSDYDSMEDL